LFKHYGKVSCCCRSGWASCCSCMPVNHCMYLEKQQVMLSKTKIWNGSAWVKARAKIYSSGAWKTVIQGSGLNQSNITDAMMEEDVDYYMASEDEADVYLQLVEE
jgi:hypothetical protein